MKTIDDNAEVEDRLRAYGLVLDESVLMRARSADIASQPRSQRRSLHLFARRTSQRAVVVGLVGVLLAVGGSLMSSRRADRSTVRVATTTSTLQRKDTSLVFPIGTGDVQIGDSFGAPFNFADTFSAPRRDGPHQGADVFAAVNAAVLAIRGGRVDEVRINETHGRVVVRDDDGNRYVYENLGALPRTLQKGARVKTGERLGAVRAMNDALASVPPNVHIEIIPGGSKDPVNPFPILIRLVGGSAIPPTTKTLRLSFPNEKTHQEIQLQYDAAATFPDLHSAAARAGFRFQVSGFRSPELQLKLRERKCGSSLYDKFLKPPSKCTEPVALPFHSARERGLAVDFMINNSKDGLRTGSPAHKWLVANAAKYSFTQTLADEPWHWEYTGPRTGLS